LQISKHFAAREKPSLKISTKTFLVGTLAAMEDNGSVSYSLSDYKVEFCEISHQFSVYQSLEAFVLETSTPVPVEIIVSLEDVSKIRQNYEQASIEFVLRPKALNRIHKYLQQFGK
jgi:hypothetical protein